MVVLKEGTCLMRLAGLGGKDLGDGAKSVLCYLFYSFYSQNFISFISPPLYKIRNPQSIHSPK